MALDNLENKSLAHLATHKKLSYGLVQSVVNVKNNEVSSQIGKPKGVYVTYDASGAKDVGYAEYLSKLMANTLKMLVGAISDKSLILCAGLGNGQVLADSLGKKIVDKIQVTRTGYLTDSKYLLCAHSLGVQGVTGIKSHEILTALNDKLHPSAILIFDTLATAEVRRLGTSFQLSTAGIVPGGGVGVDNPRLDKSVFGVPTISIGVPLVLTMQGVLKGFLKEYDGEVLDEFKLQSTMSERKLSRLIVAPKEVKIYLDNAMEIISSAVNIAFSK